MLRATYPTNPKNQERFARLFNIYLFLLFTPFAHYFDSIMLGYFSVIAFYGIIGFSVACYGLCYVIGFSNDDAMGRVVSTSTILLIVFAGLKITGIHKALVNPFSSAVMTMGTLTLFLALLIISSKFYRSRDDDYYKNNLLFVLALVIATFVGFVFNIEPIRNTAITFEVLYAMEKTTESVRWNEGTIMVFLLGFSVALYFTSYFLSSHPEFIISMFSGL